MFFLVAADKEYVLSGNDIFTPQIFILN